MGRSFFLSLDLLNDPKGLTIWTLKSSFNPRYPETEVFTFNGLKEALPL